MNMKRSIVIALSLTLLPLVMRAQESEPPRVMANAFFGGGGVFAGGGHAGIVNLGGGGEARLYKGLAVGTELGYLYPTRSLREGLGLLSTNGTYRFWTSPSQRVVPFITGGY